MKEQPLEVWVPPVLEGFDPVAHRYAWKRKYLRKLSLAKRLRKAPRYCEDLVLEYLQYMHRYGGWPYPQHQVLACGYIADFYLRDVGLIVEVWNEATTSDYYKEYSAARDKHLGKSVGKVIRLEATEIAADVEKAMMPVAAWIASRRRKNRKNKLRHPARRVKER